MASQPEIFYVLNSRWPTVRAYGLQVAKTCQGFKSSGAKVRLVIPIRKQHQALRGRSPFDIYGIHDPFRIIRIPSLDFARVHLNGKIFFVIQQTLFAAMTAVALAFKRGAVYSRDPFTLYLLSFIRSNIFWEVHRVPENIRSAVYRRLLRRCSGIICITDGIRRKFIEDGVPAIKLLVSPDGIDIAEFEIPQSPAQAKMELGLDAAKHHVIYTGNYMEWKGVGTLVAASQLLDDRFRVTIVGGTAAEIAPMRVRDTAGKIRFEPFQTHDRIPLWLRAADTVVLPNRKDAGISEFYTSPLKMFEYMAAGKRIVASDLHSIREILNDSNAILVTPDDPAALSAGITRSADDEEASRARAEQALSDAHGYTWGKRCRNILDFISHAIPA